MKRAIEGPKFKSRIYQYIAAVGANLGTLSLGFHYGWPSTAFPTLLGENNIYKLSKDEASWLVSLVPLTSIIGGVLGACLTNKLGRKRIIHFSSIPLTISWILIAVADSKTNLFVSRAIAGIIDGLLFTIVPSYLTEIADADIRGFIVGTFASTLAFGVLVENILLSLFTISTTACASATVTVLSLFILPLVPESPYFFLIVEKEIEARKSIRKLIGKYDVRDRVENIQKGIDETEGKTKLSDIFFYKSHRQCLVLSILLTLTQLLSGLLPFEYYTKTVLLETNSFLVPSTANIIYHVSFFLITIVCFTLTDRIGRRVLILLSVGVTAACLFFNGLYLYIKLATNIDTSTLDFLQLVFVYLYTVGYGVGLHVIPIIFIAEIFPTHLKSVALCIVNIITNVAVALAIKLFSWYTSYGLFVPFLVCSGCAVIQFILIAKFLPETKLLTMEAIQIEQDKRQCKYHC
ncbi:facilitated trehalose transporter Tret1-like [Diabrotica virgifera virgifera]|uniref:Major facilitator superfamily (MFS) profile domain-containing protein n=1 Tax=Diabrotica virgifera virgifera TaxID=50390 RepID=A0ABM5IMD7_DIAVI|nr:facilitated trehalose transporter Tret1-like [Diabrotica virgifera virgifera]